jgi:WD40 repeat protein
MTRTAELTAKLLDGTLSEAEGAELDALLAGDPGAEAEHLALVQLEAELRGLRTGFDLVESTLAQVAAAQANRTAQAVLEQITTAPPPAWSPRVAEPASKPEQPAPTRRTRWAGLAALAACAARIRVFFLTGKAPQVPPDDVPSAPTAFAKLSRLAGSVELLSPTGDVIPAVEGGELPGGFTVHTVGDESLAIVELIHDRTRVEIESDSVVRFAGSSPESAGKPRVYLAAGQITAAVPERPDDHQPLVVATAVAEFLTRDGTFVLSSAGPESARVDIKRGKVEMVRTATPKPVRLHAGGTAVVFAGNDKLDIEHGQTVDRTPRRTLTVPGARDVAFSPDGSEVWVASARSFTRWALNGTTTETSFYPRKGNDGPATITRNKKFLVTFRGDGGDRVLVRTLPDGGEQAALNTRLGESRFWAVAPNASWLAAVEPKLNNKRVRVLDGKSGEERFTRDFAEPVACVAAAPDARHLAVGVHANIRGGVGNKVVVLDAYTGDQYPALQMPRRPLLAMTFSPDGHTLAAGFNGTIQLWDWRIQELVRTIHGFERPLVCLAYSSDGKRLAAATQDGHVWLWDTATGRQTQLIDVGSRAIRDLAFSPNGKQLVTLANNAAVAVWDVVDRTLPAANLQ